MRSSRGLQFLQTLALPTLTPSGRYSHVIFSVAGATFCGHPLPMATCTQLPAPFPALFSPEALITTQHIIYFTNLFYLLSNALGPMLHEDRDLVCFVHAIHPVPRPMPNRQRSSINISLKCMNSAERSDYRVNLRCHGQRSVLASTRIESSSGKIHKTDNSIYLEGEKFTYDFTAVCTSHIFRSLEYFSHSEMSG